MRFNRSSTGSMPTLKRCHVCRGQAYQPQRIRSNHGDAYLPGWRASPPSQVPRTEHWQHWLNGAGMSGAMCASPRMLSAARRALSPEGLPGIRWKTRSRHGSVSSCGSGWASDAMRLGRSGRWQAFACAEKGTACWAVFVVFCSILRAVGVGSGRRRRQGGGPREGACESRVPPAFVEVRQSLNKFCQAPKFVNQIMN